MLLRNDNFMKGVYWNEKMKKFLAGLAAGVICAAALPLAGAELPNGNGLVLAKEMSFRYGVSEGEYTVSTETGSVALNYVVWNDGTISINDCPESITGTLEIPSEIEGRPVTGIYSAFFDCVSLTEVIIPDSVTSIGRSAFENCTALTDISIPDSVTYIGDSAFENCTALTDISIPDGVTEIGYSAFENCTALAEIAIPDSIENIGYHAFEGTVWMKAKLAESPLVIASHILIDGTTCSGSVMIPDDVTEIEFKAFENCTALTEITIPGSVKNIGSDAFLECSNLEKVNLSEGLSYIGEEAFRDCTALKEIIFPESTEEISYNSFRGCTNLETVVIPENVATIEGSAFWETPWIAKMQKENPLVIINGILVDGRTCTGKVIIPDTVTKIASWAFCGCGTMQEVQIPEGVTELLESNFYDCSSLEKITIPISMTYIEEDTFMGCDKLTDIYYLGTKEQWDAIENMGLGGSVHFSDGTKTLLKADLDGNGKIDTSDIFDAMVYVAYRGVGLDGGLTDEQVAAADIDGDGKVDSTDIYYMLYYVALQGAGKNPSWQDVIY